MLFEVDDRAYCGPTAIMAVTGLRLPAVREAINAVKDVRTNRGVMGLSIVHLERALARLGARTRYTQPNPRPTLLKWAENAPQGQTFVIWVSSHYVAFRDGMVVDPFTRYGCPVAEHYYARKRVNGFWSVDGVTAPEGAAMVAGLQGGAQ